MDLHELKENFPNCPLRLSLSRDLNEKLNSFNNSSAALRSFETQTGISSRQVERYLKGKTFPQYQNLLKVYQFITSEWDETNLLEKIHSPIKEELIKKRPNLFSKKTFQEKDYSKEIENNPAFRYIYWATSEQGVISLSDIEIEFGNFGKTTLQEMLDDQLIQHIGFNQYSTGIKRSKSIGTNATVSTCKHLLDNYFRSHKSTEEGNNIIAHNILSLDKENYQEALKILENTFYQIRDLEKTNQEKPSRYFMLLAADSMKLRTKH